MIHDWFTHGEGDTSRLVDIPLPPGDDWHEDPMRIPRIKNDPSRPAGAEGPITSVNDVTHWWDGSSLYGSSLDEQKMVRSGAGREAAAHRGRPPADPRRPEARLHHEARLVDRHGHAASRCSPASTTRSATG